MTAVEADAAVGFGGHDLSSRIICGVSVRSGAPDHCVAAIDEALARQPVRLGFVNTFTAYLLRNDQRYRAALRGFTLLNDGVGLDIVSLIKYGRRFGANLNGTDFTPHYLKHTRRRHRIYLLGGRPGIAERAAAALRMIAPQHAYVGTRDGYFPAEHNAHIIADIRAQGATLVIVALGNPLQEMWIADHLEATGADLAIGVGALLDFLAGEVPRAPPWVRRLKLEWLYRMTLEPKRLWRRYVVFTPMLILHALGERSGLVR